MKTTMSFLTLLFLPLLLNAKPKRPTLYIPLVHNGATFYDSKVVAPPLSSPHSMQGLVFMAELYFGSSQVRQHLQLDTGSSLTWTQCFPCTKCFKQKILPKYRPDDSVTYRKAMCEPPTTESNQSIPYISYDPWTRTCEYQQSYLDGTNIKGTLAQEMIRVETLEGGYKSFYGVFFGCNTEGTGKISGTGILGLGVGKYSIIGEFGSKFSFCFGPISEPKAPHNLILGDGANLQGNPTVFNITKDNHYTFMLESIMVGEELTLDDPVEVLVDTGSSVSHLSRDLYYKFGDEFDDLLGRPLSYEPMLCYKAETIERLEEMEIGFVFAGRAKLSVNVHSIFIPGSSGTRCLAMMNNKGSYPKSIIGVIAMQGYNLGYDLKSKTAYFLKQDCDLSNM